MSRRLNMRLTVPAGSPMYEHLKDLEAAAARHELMYLANCGLRLNVSGRLMATPITDSSNSSEGERENSDLKINKSASNQEPTKNSVIEKKSSPVDVGDFLDNYT